MVFFIGFEPAKLNPSSSISMSSGFDASVSRPALVTSPGKQATELDDERLPAPTEPVCSVYVSASGPSDGSRQIAVTRRVREPTMPTTP